jgi:FixJ family two-component response regulator
MTQPANRRALVCVVDDDESVREALPDLLREFDFAACAFASAEDFLASDELLEADCLVLDVAMPGMTGPELHMELKRRASGIPVVFITAQSDEDVLTSLFAQGAIACLLKPFADTSLFDAVTTAVAAGGGAGDPDR